MLNVSDRRRDAGDPLHLAAVGFAAFVRLGREQLEGDRQLKSCRSGPVTEKHSPLAPGPDLLLEFARGTPVQMLPAEQRVISSQQSQRVTALFHH